MHEKFLERRIQVVTERERELLENPGWFVHYVFETDAGELNGMANYHTHGLSKNFNHPDIQITLPIDPNVVHPVLNGMVRDIKNGKVFHENERSSEVLRGMDVYFKAYREGRRWVLRMLLPDPNGKLPFEEGCEEIYTKQLEELPL